MGCMGTVTRGRPRTFDRDLALNQAMLLFWERGYDTVGVSELTESMGISAASMYAAFGDKKSLFEEAIEAYIAEHGAYIADAIERAPSARAMVERILGTAAVNLTQPGMPAGCLLINGTTNYSARSADIAVGLRERRNEATRLIERRITDDRDAGALPGDLEPHVLAHYVVAVWRGMAQLARDGASRQDLLGVVRMTMSAWPPRSGQG